LATKSAKNVTGAIQGLSVVENPVEFIELQQKLIKEGVEAAVSDCHHIAQLTSAVFYCCFRASEKAGRGGAEGRIHLGLGSHNVGLGVGLRRPDVGFRRRRCAPASGTAATNANFVLAG
jgi:hypothetical protein